MNDALIKKEYSNPLFQDTRPEAKAVLLDLLRKAPRWRKLQMTCQLNATVRTLTLSGLRQRHPNADKMELHHRLAMHLLGPELVDQLYQTRLATGVEKRELIMNDEAIAVTLLVTEVLDELDIPYLIGGSLASTIHGIARATLDSDLVAHIELQHVSIFVEKLNATFYASEDAIYDAIIHHSSFNLIHLETMFKVDIFIPKVRAFEQAQFANRTKLPVATNPERMAFVATAEDSILAKLEWYRLGGESSDRQWGDIMGIVEVQQERLNVAYLTRQAAMLDVSDLLKQALGDMIQEDS